MSINRVVLAGRLTRDPEVVMFQGGGKVAKFSIAVNNAKKNKQTGQWEDDPAFVDVQVFNVGQGTQADRVEKMAKKGQLVCVDGKIKMDSWQHEGQRRTKLYVLADGVEFIERPQQQQATTAPQQPRQSPPQQQQASNEYQQPQQYDDIPF